MGKSDLLYITSTVGQQDATRELHLPDALSRLESRAATLKLRDGNLCLNWQDADWKRQGLWLPPEEGLERIAERLQGAKSPGVDGFLRGARGAKGPTYRTRSVEKYDGSDFTYSGIITPGLKQIAELVFAEFGDDPALSNGGVYNKRYIAGTTKWSQHAYGNAIDLMIGSDMHLGDQIARFLRANERRVGGYCELLWRVPSHYDHIHVSASPCRAGNP